VRGSSGVAAVVATSLLQPPCCDISRRLPPMMPAPNGVLLSAREHRFSAQRRKAGNF
jgi:hypothetical protein